MRTPISQYQWTPGALVATGVSGPIVLPNSDFEGLTIGLSIASVAGTTPTLDLYIQTLGPDGNYYDMYHFAQQSANTTANNQIFVKVSAGGSSLVGTVGSKTVAANTLGVGLLSNTIQFAYTIAGTSPSFTPTVNVYAPAADRNSI